MTHLDPDVSWQGRELPESEKHRNGRGLNINHKNKDQHKKFIIQKSRQKDLYTTDLNY